MKRILIVGGANGIGLSIAKQLALQSEIEIIYIVDRVALKEEYRNDKIHHFVFDLNNQDYSIFDQFTDIDSLLITAGFGRLALFKDIPEEMLSTYFTVNTVAPIRIIKHFYDKLLHDDNFYCGVMVSIAGYLSSPFFSVYAATKAALRIFIESVNVELVKSGSTNRILNVSPGRIKGTSFYNEKEDISQTIPLAKDIIQAMKEKSDLLIPQYKEIYKDVLERYHADFRAEGLHSYEYKINNGRVETTKKAIYHDDEKTKPY